ncbi:unnamed protein product, partial [Didymodactylos carnosus]
MVCPGLLCSVPVFLYSKNRQLKTSLYLMNSTLSDHLDVDTDESLQSFSHAIYPPQARYVRLQKVQDHDSFGVYIEEDISHGLYVVTVENNSPAFNAQIQPGDRILGVNDQRIANVQNPKEFIVEKAINARSIDLVILPSNILHTVLSTMMTNYVDNPNSQYYVEQTPPTSYDFLIDPKHLNSYLYAKKYSQNSLHNNLERSDHPRSSYSPNITDSDFSDIRLAESSNRHIHSKHRTRHKDRARHSHSKKYKHTENASPVEQHRNDMNTSVVNAPLHEKNANPRQTSRNSSNTNNHQTQQPKIDVERRITQNPNVLQPATYDSDLKVFPRTDKKQNTTHNQLPPSTLLNEHQGNLQQKSNTNATKSASSHGIKRTSTESKTRQQQKQRNSTRNQSPP